MVTIKDIAKAAGVTYVTVSRALNDEPGVSEQTRQAIKALAEQMDYVPSLAAKKLAQRQPDTIGMIWPRIKGLFFYDLGFEIQQEASRRGLQVIMSMVSVEEALRTFNRYFVDYIVYWRPVWNPTLEFLQEKEKFRGEMLLLGGWKTDRAHSITIDRTGAFLDAVRHLAELGHNSIAFIGQQSDLEKYNGYMQGMAEGKLDYRQELVVNTFDPDFEAKFKQMMSASDRPSALVVDSQGTLFRTNRLLRQLDIHVPEQLSLVVYDDIPELDFFDVPLTTIGPSIGQMAKRTLDILTRDREPTDDGERWLDEEIRCQLTVRSSTIPWKGK